GGVMTPLAVPRPVPAVEDAGHEPVRVAVIGLGYWGPNLVRNLDECAGADLVAVCDTREDALAKIRRRSPSVRTTTALEALLADDDIEGVALATPASTHHPT